MPPPKAISHFSARESGRWSIFLSFHPIDSYCSGCARGAYGTQTEQQASKHGIASCFGPATRRRGERSGRPPEKSPAFRRKIPVFRQEYPHFCRRKGRKTAENAFFFRVNLVNCGRCRTFAIANGKQARCHNERPQRNTPSLMIKQVDRMCNGEVAELVDALL